MRAKEYLAINNTSLKYPAEIKRIVADMSPLRASREQTVDYYNKHLIPDMPSGLLAAEGSVRQE